MARSRGNHGSKKYKYREQRNEEYLKRKKISSIKNLIHKSQYSKALSELEEYLEKYPNDSYGLFQRATIYQNIGKKDLAKEEYERIIDLDLESKYSALFKLALIAIDEKDYDDACDKLRRNIETSPYDELYSILQLSNIELLKGNKDEAERVLELYANQSEDRIILQKAMVSLNKENYKHAKKILEGHRFNNDPDIISKYYEVKGATELKLRLYDEALESFNKSIDLDINNIHVNKTNIDIATLYYESGNYVDAYNKCVDILLDKNSSHKENAAIILGFIEKYEENYVAAEKHFKEAIEYQVYPNSKGYYFLAELYALIGQYDKAREYYNRCIRTSKSPRLVNSSYFRLAIVNMRQENLEGFYSNLSKVNKKALTKTEKANYTFYKSIVTRDSNEIKLTHTYLQLNDYSIDRLIEHIDKTHELYNQKSVFNENIDLEELVLQTPELLENAHLVENSVVDLYHVKYENIGYVSGKKTDLLEIVTFPDSKKIITMYPHNEIILENKKEKSKSKVKQSSQLSKFYSKYGKM